MKKYLVLFIMASSVVLFNGCDLDTLPLNVPVSIDVNLTGNTNSATVSESFSLDEYDDFVGDDINNISYVQSAFRVKTISNAALTGNIQVSLSNGSGFNFTQTLNNVKPADYIGNPFILNFTAEQVQAINQYINSTANRTFTATVAVSNISAAQPPHSITGVIDMIFEVETEL